MEQKSSPDLTRDIENKVSKDLKFIAEELNLEKNKRSYPCDDKYLRKLSEAHNLLERAYEVRKALKDLQQEVGQ